MEHLDVVNIFSVQAEGGRKMRDEAGKGVEVIGEVHVPKTLICCELFPMAKREPLRHFQ